MSDQWLWGDGSEILWGDGETLGDGGFSSLSSAATAVGVTFDGTNDYLTRGADLTGSADGTTLVVSFWINTASTPTNSRVLIGQAGAIDILVNASGQIECYLANAAFSSELYFRGSANLEDNAWHHVLIAVDAGAAPASRVRQIYVDDAAETVTTILNTGAGSFNIDFTQTNWGVGGYTTGSDKISGDLAELFYAPLQFLDFSVEANRRKFITASGSPIDLGEDGSGPTGTSPVVYLSIRDAQAASEFATNRGTGGNFTINGALATATFMDFGVVETVTAIPPTLTYGAGPSVYERKVRAFWERQEELERRRAAAEQAQRARDERMRELQRQQADLDARKKLDSRKSAVAKRRAKLAREIAEIEAANAAAQAEIDQLVAQINAAIAAQEMMADRRRRMVLLLAAAA